MASMLEGQLAKLVHEGFKGRLSKGTLRRRDDSGGRDEYGDPATTTYVTYEFEGVRDNFSQFVKGVAGIPDGDVNILVIANSLSVEPKRGDQIKIKGSWFEVRDIIRDPADATYELQSFEIPDPT